MTRRRVILLVYLLLLAAGLVITRSQYPWLLAGEQVWSTGPTHGTSIADLRLYRADVESGENQIHLMAFWQGVHAWSWHTRPISLPGDARGLQYSWDGRILHITFRQPDGRLGTSTVILAGP